MIERYLDKIREATLKPGVYAYRGQADSSWSLRSGATRRMIGEAGDEIQSELRFPQMYVSYHLDTLLEPARTQGFGIEEVRSISDLQLLAKLQHFGAATGLLDFTWDPLIALWFACQGAPCRDGKLYVVNTNDTIHFARISNDENEHKIENVFISSRNSPALYYWEPTLNGDAMPRILRQRSVFVIGRPLIPEDPRIVADIEISRDDKAAILKDLQILDVSHSTLFQDVYGFSQAEGVSSPIRQIREPKWYLMQGNRLYQNGAFSEAIYSYSECISLDPEVSEPYFLRGNARTAIREYEIAIQDYTSAIRQKNRTFLDFGLGKDIEEELRHPFMYMVFFNRANAKAELEELEGALSDFNESIRLNSESAESFFNRGNIHLDLHELEEAVRDYDRASDLGLMNALYNKGNALVLLGRFSDALKCYLSLEQQLEDAASATQNRISLENVISRIGDSEYEVRLENNANYGGLIHLKVLINSDKEIESLYLAFKGRIGNTGGFGWMNQRGGTGLEGKLGFVVSVENTAAHPSSSRRS